ncbi:hypothetical protein NEISUBOT_03631 [Neisseria subflava NJ9703]|uniref:Uncharacterized protein n=1 Tax=Neisseria subflava NJ9703 TaxID=546268 RepID=A0A9W5ISD2_NEISU|nr:hypothetical protein NEISUBOT_03631 [Neisseria subflava NJ9703]
MTMATHQRHGSSGIRLHRRATAWAIGFKKRRFFHITSIFQFNQHKV